MIEPVTDRNLMDVNIAKEFISKIQASGYNSLTDSEKTQWQSGLKGFLNYTDLNRIESNSAEIAEMVGVSITAPKTNWTMTDIPTLQDFQRIRDNVQRIRASNYVHSDTPVTPELPLNRYEKINDIEKIQFDVYNIYSKNKNAISYIDEIYINENVGVL